MATEKRLIDANALLDRMSFVTNDTTCPLHIAACIDQEIELAPTVDAVEVVHGRWIPVKSMELTFRCSACTSWWTKFTIHEPNYPYCPYCGADMRNV